MAESFIPSSEFETASNAVNNILGQPVEEIEITDILPPLNDITDSNKVFKGKQFGIRADIHDSLPVTELWVSFRIAMWTTKLFLHLVKQ